MDINELWIFLLWMLNIIAVKSEGAEDGSYVKLAKEHDALIQRFGHYELVVPTLVDHGGEFVSYDLINSRKRTRRHASMRDASAADKHINYKLSAYGKNFHLNLTLNHKLVSPNYVVEREDRTGVVHRHSFVDDCHYRGHIVGHELSKVAVSNCDGLNGLFITQEDEYFIEPLGRYSQAKFFSEGHAHIVYKRSSFFNPTSEKKGNDVHFKCGVKDKEKRSTRSWFLGDKDLPFAREVEEQMRNGRNRHRRHRRATNLTISSESNENNVESLIVTEKEMIKYHGEGNIEAYLLTLLNIVADLYHDASIGNFINIVVSRMRLLLEDQDDMTLNFHAGRSLDNFCNWQAELNRLENDTDDGFGQGHHDVAVLITRYDICHKSNEPCQTIGLARLGAMCNPHTSCNINQDTGLATAFTVAHEIGHNFGMRHDGDGNTCGSGGGIMAGTYTQNTDFYSWSICSKSYITHFIESGKAVCLNNDPDHEIGSTPTVKPGQLLDGDRQCSLQRQEGATVCNTHNLCRELLCKLPGQSVCVGTSVPAAEGTRCATRTIPQGWCYLGECVELGERPQAVDGGWGEWDPWSECSRTCGGGVMKSERHCDSPRPQHRGQYCIGERVRYISCNTQDCPPGTLDFHTEQCAQFNTEAVDGQLYQWVPLIKGNIKPCELTCASTRAGHSQRVPMVKDGTRCYSEKLKPNVYDICINGACKQVGCDRLLGSSMIEDKCRVCDGDGHTCETVTGLFNDSLVENDYQEILSIPIGSTHIRVEEEEFSINYLALKTVDDVFHINANWLIEWPKLVEVGGTTFKYDRPTSDPESLSAFGPTTEELIVMLLVQDTSKGVRYTFNRPVTRTSLGDEVMVFAWQRAPWTDCSTTCAGGVSVAEVHCIRQDDHSVVSDSYCNNEEKPPTRTKTCNAQACPPQWSKNFWSECSQSCGGGTKTRQVFCSIKVSELAVENVDESNCLGHKPVTSMACGEEDCPPQWVLGRWSPCRPSCGPGRKTREVQCRSSSGQRTYYSTNMCDRSRRPPSHMQCQNPDCPPPRWTAGQWSECSAKCGVGRITRPVYCLAHSGNIMQDAYCSSATKPERTRQCKRTCNNIEVADSCVDDNSVQYCPLVKKFSFCNNDYFNRICCRTCSELGETIAV